MEQSNLKIPHISAVATKKKTDGRQMRQAAFIKAFPRQGFNVSRTSTAVGLDRSTFQKWIACDPEFAMQFDLAKQTMIDMWEEALYNKIVEDKDTTAIIFALKTLGKERGYVEGNRVSVVDKSPILTAVIDGIAGGTMTVFHGSLELTKAGIPLPETIKILLSRTETAEQTDKEISNADELDRRYLEAIQAVERQIECLPERRQQVEALKA